MSDGNDDIPVDPNTGTAETVDLDLDDTALTNNSGFQDNGADLDLADPERNEFPRRRPSDRHLRRPEKPPTPEQ